MLQLYNTLTRRKEPFNPIKPGEIRMYCCGPTVYFYAHIGNFRAFIFEDVLRRILEFNGFKVTHVMNITDVGHLTSDADTGEDKMEVGAAREKKSVWEIADFYARAFFESAEMLNILKPTIVCKATDHIQDMIAAVQNIEKNGYTYIIEESGVYFDTSKLKDYGILTGMDFERLNENLKAGARVEFIQGKRNVTDFGLWFFSPKDRKRQMEWDSPWGMGFPGWHIECSAMSMKYLGEQFDIHCGGIDHIPIHHTNEIAQSEAITGKPPARYWLHNAFLIFGGSAKMAKSKGNVVTVQNLAEEGYDPLAFRYLCLTAHYRSELVFTWESLQSAQNALSTLREHMRNLGGDVKRPAAQAQNVEEYRKEFLDAINDDLSTPRALATVWRLVRDEKGLSNKEKYDLLMEFDRILGLDLARQEEKLSPELEELIKQREEARKRKDWEAADRIRKKLADAGIIIEDSKHGMRWKKVSR